MAQVAELRDRLPTPDESEKAADAVSVVSQALAEQHSLSLTIEDDAEGMTFELPGAVGHLVLELLEMVARGHMVTLVPYGSELTTQQAADILNVSRPYLISLLDKEVIQHHRVGTHRRVKAEHLFTYKDRRDRERRIGLKELQRLGQEFDEG